LSPWSQYWSRRSYGRNDLWKRQVLNSDWKSYGWRERGINRTSADRRRWELERLGWNKAGSRLQRQGEAYRKERSITISVAATACIDQQHIHHSLLPYMRWKSLDHSVEVCQFLPFLFFLSLLFIHYLAKVFLYPPSERSELARYHVMLFSVRPFVIPYALGI